MEEDDGAEDSDLESDDGVTDDDLLESLEEDVEEID